MKTQNACVHYHSRQGKTRSVHCFWVRNNSDLRLQPKVHIDNFTITEISIIVVSVVKSVSGNHSDAPWCSQTIATQLAGMLHGSGCSHNQSNPQVKTEFRLLQGPFPWLSTLNGRTETSSRTAGLVNPGPRCIIPMRISVTVSLYSYLPGMTSFHFWGVQDWQVIQKDGKWQIGNGLIRHNQHILAHHNGRYQGCFDDHDHLRKTVYAVGTTKSPSS